MNELLFQYLIGNLILAAPVAFIAYLVQRTHRFAFLAHVLWVFVLVKLLTPPLATLPVLAVPAWNSPPPLEAEATVSSELVIASQQESASRVPLTYEPLTVPDMNRAKSNPDLAPVSTIKLCLLVTWLSGIAWIFLRSLTRIHRFHILMQQACRRGEPALQALTRETAERFDLSKAPQIYTAPAQISPLVWWLGGRVKIIIPEALLETIASHELRLIIAHEMAHIKRRDHWVRWIEWLACAVFWWNPLVWWAGHNLRTNEEICCDALVLSRLRTNPRHYAGALLKVIEYLAEPVVRPPVMACAVSSGGCMEQRFEMIVDSKKLKRTPRWLCLGIVLIGFSPLGIVDGQDFEAVERRLGEGVREGELSLSQAAVMLDTLKRLSNQNGAMQRLYDEFQDERMSLEERPEYMPLIGNLFRNKHHGDRREERLMQRIREIEIAIKDGRMSAEEVYLSMIEETKRHLEQERRDHGEDGDRREERVMQRIREIEIAIKDGRISREEGTRRIESIKKALAEIQEWAAENNGRGTDGGRPPLKIL